MTVATSRIRPNPNYRSDGVLSLSVLQPSGSSGIRINPNPGLLANNIITLVFVVAAILTLYQLVAGAMRWIVSGGDKGKVEEARDRIFAAIIGLLIMACTWAVFQLAVTIAFGVSPSELRLPTFVDGLD